MHSYTQKKRSSASDTRFVLMFINKYFVFLPNVNVEVCKCICIYFVLNFSVCNKMGKYQNSMLTSTLVTEEEAKCTSDISQKFIQFLNVECSMKNLERELWSQIHSVERYYDSTVRNFIKMQTMHISYFHIVAWKMWPSFITFYLAENIQ